MNNRLTDTNLISGINKCLLNAEDLIKDATLLKENARIARAYTLFQLANEEIGKSLLLYFFASLPDANKPEKFNEFKKEFINHKIKTSKAINLDSILLASIKRKSSRKKFYEAILLEYTQLENLNNLKNYSLYTSIVDYKFKSPKEIITKKVLKSIEIRATTRLALSKSFFEFTLPNFHVLKTQAIKTEGMFDIDSLAAEFINDLLK